MAANKKTKIKLSEHANVLTIRERGGKPVRLPISMDDNRKLAQYEAAKFRGILDEYMEANRDNLENAKPRELRELGEAWRIAHELATNAYSPNSADGPSGGGKTDDAKLFSEIARHSMEMGQKLEAARAKQEPIEAETVEGDNGDPD